MIHSNTPYVQIKLLQFLSTQHRPSASSCQSSLYFCHRPNVPCPTVYRTTVTAPAGISGGYKGAVCPLLLASRARASLLGLLMSPRHLDRSTRRRHRPPSTFSCVLIMATTHRAGNPVARDPCPPPATVTSAFTSTKNAIHSHASPFSPPPSILLSRSCAISKKFRLDIFTHPSRKAGKISTSRRARRYHRIGVVASNRNLTGEIDAVRLVGPREPITKRGLAGFLAVASSHASLASRALSKFSS